MNTDNENNNELADLLLLGSRNIDRMIDELTQLTHMLIGRFPYTGLYTLEQRFKSNDKKVLWAVIFTEDCLIRQTVTITARTLFNADAPVTFNSNHPKSCIKREIQKVYEAREVLTRGLLDRFPEIKKSLEPIFEASKVKFPY